MPNRKYGSNWNAAPAPIPNTWRFTERTDSWPTQSGEPLGDFHFSGPPPGTPNAMPTPHAWSNGSFSPYEMAAAGGVPDSFTEAEPSPVCDQSVRLLANAPETPMPRPSCDDRSALLRKVASGPVWSATATPPRAGWRGFTLGTREPPAKAAVG